MTGTEQQEDLRFSCAACGKQYRWKAELAGKKVKCKCGQPVAVPTAASIGATATAPAPRAAAKPQPRPAAPVPPKPVKALGPEDEPGLDLDGLYALANDEQQASAAANDAAAQGYRCPGCGAALAAGSAVCTGCGTDLRTGRKLKTSAGQGAAPAAMLAYAGSNSGGVAAGPGGFTAENLVWEGSKLRNLYLPLAFILAGLIVAYVQVFMIGRSRGLEGSAVIAVFVAAIAIDAVCVLAALFAAAKFMDMGFGHFGPALIKTFAIAAAPGAVVGIIELMMGGGLGSIMVGVIVALVLYYALIKLFFNLDLEETLVLAGIIYVMRRWVGGLLLIAAFGLLTSTGAMSSDTLARATQGPGAAAARGPSPAEQQRQMTRMTIDGRAAEALAMQGAGEAREWLGAHKAHTLEKLDRANSEATVENLYKLGAKKVSVAGIYQAGLGDGEYKANVLIVELPTPDPDAKPAKVAKKAPAKPKAKPAASDDDEDADAEDLTTPDDEIDQEIAAMTEGMNATLPPGERQAREALLAEEPKINQQTSGRHHAYPDVGQRYIVIRGNGRYDDD